MNIMFLDIESSGLDSDHNGIIQIAAEFHQNGKLVSRFNKKLSPIERTHEINIGAMAVNNARFSELYNREPKGTVLRAFADFLADCKKKAGRNPILPSGQNVKFDIEFLQKTLKEEGITGFTEVLSYRVLDTSTIAQFLINTGKINLQSYSLQKLAKYFKVDTIEQGDDALVNASFHDAAFDVKMTADVYYAMENLIKG